jgi:hypothetical protein
MKTKVIHYMLTDGPFSLLRIVTVPYFWFASEVGKRISDLMQVDKWNRMFEKGCED